MIGLFQELRAGLGQKIPLSLRGLAIRKRGSGFSIFEDNACP